jgi:hypothetical protein
MAVSTSMRMSVLFFLGLSILFFALSIFKAVEKFSTIYDHPSKCFSCEQDMIARFGPEWAWMGQNTKSFDAEREMIRMTGDVGSAVDTHPIKYY